MPIPVAIVLGAWALAIWVLALVAAVRVLGEPIVAGLLGVGVAVAAILDTRRRRHLCSPTVF